MDILIVTSRRGGRG